MPPRLPELVGRLMIDPELLAEIQRAPDSVLGQYELSDEERTAVRQAVERLGDTVLLKRVST
jgi:hypothetical protein